MDLEDDQVVGRFLDHDFKARLGSVFSMSKWTTCGSKDGLYLFYIQPGARVVDQSLNKLFHLLTTTEQ